MRSAKEKKRKKKPSKTRENRHKSVGDSMNDGAIPEKKQLFADLRTWNNRTGQNLNICQEWHLTRLVFLRQQEYNKERIRHII